MVEIRSAREAPLVPSSLLSPPLPCADAREGVCERERERGSEREATVSAGMFRLGSYTRRGARRMVEGEGGKRGPNGQALQDKLTVDFLLINVLDRVILAV